MQWRSLGRFEGNLAARRFWKWRMQGKEDCSIWKRKRHPGPKLWVIYACSEMASHTEAQCNDLSMKAALVLCPPPLPLITFTVNLLH